MKKFLFLLSAIAFFAVSAKSQIIENNPILKSELRIQQVPAEFTSDGQVQVWLMERTGRNQGVNVLIDEDLNEKKRFEINGYGSMCFVNLNQLYEADYGFYICQTLFNSDDKYEYIVPVSSNNDDYRATGFQIVSEGTVLQTVNFPNGISVDSEDFYPTIIKIGNKLYLDIEEVRDSNYNYYELIYKIDRTASSVSMVRQDYVGKTRKVYRRGKLLIENEEGDLYTPEGVEVNRE